MQTNSNPLQTKYCKRLLGHIALLVTVCGSPCASTGIAAEKRTVPLHLHVVSGSKEYQSEQSLKSFVNTLRKKYAVKVTASWVEDGARSLPQIDALAEADVLLIFARRLKLPAEQVAKIKAHVAAGKPVVGVRTASHALSRDDNVWLDHEVFGGNYQGHHGRETVTVSTTPLGKTHPIMTDVGSMTSTKLYKAGELSQRARVLQFGSINQGDTQAPVTWVHDVKGARMFYTSLGVPSDFKNAAFRTMLTQAIFWVAKQSPAALRKSESANQEATGVKIYQVTRPPAELKLPKFYQKYVSATGYPIVSSAQVNDYALKEAAYLVDAMLTHRPDIREAMIKSGSRLIVMGYQEYTTDIPEYARMTPKNYWDARARGLGGSRTDPVCSCAEENVLGYPGDPYHTECIVIHEFAHNMHLRGLVRIDESFDARLKKAYESAMAAGLWKGKYASTNHNEYFAEGVQSWFNNNRPPDHDHNHVDTRAELREYDPQLAAICEEVYGETKLEYTKPATRLTGHLLGYDPSKAPRFVWPAHLKKEKEKIREKARNRGKTKS